MPKFLLAGNAFKESKSLIIVLTGMMGLVLGSCQKSKQPEPFQEPGGLLRDPGKIVQPRGRPLAMANGESDDWSPIDYLVHETLEYPDEMGEPYSTDEAYLTEGESEEILRENFGNGKNLTSMGPATAAHRVMLRPDGKTLVVGRNHTGTNNNFALFRYEPDGGLDTGFSTVGRISVDFGAGRGEIAHAMATDSRGRIIAVGRYNFGTSPANYFIWAVSRFNSSGVLDTNLASTGRVLLNLTSLNAVARSVSIQTNDRIVIGGYAARQLDSVGPFGAQSPYYHKQYDAVLVRLLTNGVLDTSLGSNGIIMASLSSVSSKNDAYYAVDRASDGKIIAAGFRQDSSSYEAVITRYLTTGVLDTAFNGSGIRTVNTAASARDEFNAIVMQPDNKIVGAGFSYDGTNYSFLTARINSNGSMDTSFNRAGGSLIDISGNRDNFALGAAIQDDGKILVVGKTFGSFNYDIALVRYLTNGALDTSGFGADARAFTTIGTGDDLGYGVAFNSGVIMVVGTTGIGTNNQAIAIRYNTDGVIATAGRLDRSFGSGGFFTTSIGTTIDTVNAMAVQTDGYSLVVGGTIVGGKEHFGIARFRNDGFLDTTFQTTSRGRTFTSFTTGADMAFGVAIHTDGKFVVAGTGGVDADSFALARYLTDGRLDSSFSGDGRLLLSLTTREDDAYAVLIQTNSRVVLGGAVEPVNNQYMFGLARITSNGIMDTSFATTGQVRTNLSGREDYIYAMTLQTDGKIVVTGRSEYPANNNYDFATARYTTNGLLDTTFGTTVGGVSILAFGGSNEEARAIFIQTDGRIIVAGTSDGSGTADFAVARYTTRGILDTSFGTIGSLRIQVASGVDYAESILVQPNGKIVLVGWGSNGANDDFAVVRLNTNGTLDTSLGSNGTILLSVGTGLDRAFGAALTNDGRILGGGTVTRTTNDFGLVRIWP